MRTAVVYASNHGATERVAQQLARALSINESDLINLRRIKNFDPESYELIVVGGSIHVGRIQRPVKDFCIKYAPSLLRKKLGLFVCCMYTGEQAQSQFENNFPEKLRTHSSSNKVMGGVFDFEKMNWFEKMVVKKVAGVDKTTSNIDEKQILQMIEELTSTAKPN